jgi:hypothetical protein
MLSIRVFSLRGRFSSQFPQFYMPSSVSQLVSYFDYFALLCQIRSHSPTKRSSFSRPTEVTTEISLRKSQTVIKISLNFRCEVHFELYVLSAAYHNAPYWDRLFLSSYYLAKKKYYSLKPPQPGGVYIFYRISYFRLNGQSDLQQGVHNVFCS